MWSLSSILMFLRTGRIFSNGVNSFKNGSGLIVFRGNPKGERSVIKKNKQARRGWRAFFWHPPFLTVIVS
jgi:hypothetical protein